MEYRTVFDVAEAGYKAWTFPAFGLIFVAIGGVLVAYRKRLPVWSKWPFRSSGPVVFCVFAFAILWTGMAAVSTFSEYSALSKARAGNNVQVVEGLVTDFKPMPVTGHGRERFCVSGVCFEYSDYVVTSGFNNTSSHGGPIHEGLQVRVSYVCNTIVKLEIAK